VPTHRQLRGAPSLQSVPIHRQLRGAPSLQSVPTHRRLRSALGPQSVPTHRRLRNVLSPLSVPPRRQLRSALKLKLSLRNTGSCELIIPITNDPFFSNCLRWVSLELLGVSKCAGLTMTVLPATSRTTLLADRTCDRNLAFVHVSCRSPGLD
jgi:hypothetical protein